MTTSHIQQLSFSSTNENSCTTEFEVFLEPTCPFSKKAFDKIQPLLNDFKDEITVIIRLHSQPWHLFSPVISRCVLAASLSDGGKQASFNALTKVYEHLDQFVCEDHCRGENLLLSQQDIIDKISNLTGIDLDDAFVSPLITEEMKWLAKYARQNGIHPSPTFMVNGVIDDRFSSGQSVEEWIALLRRA